MSFAALLPQRRPRLPAIIAAEAAECGLACLAMVGRYWGHDTDLATLRARFSLSMSGLTLRSVIAVADQLHLSTRAVRTEPEHLHRLKLPAILHWDLAHFVVLKSASARRIVIHDPTFGAKTLTLREASRHFTGVALELAPQRGFVKEGGRSRIRLHSLWSSVEGLWGAAGQILLLSACLQAATFVAPFFIQFVTDGAIARRDLSLLTTLAIAFAATAVLQAALTAFRDWIVQVFGNMLSYQLIANLIRHLLHLPATFFEKRNIGDILSRVSSTSAIQETMTRGLLSVLIDGVMAVVAVAIMMFYSPVLTAIVVGTVALNAGIGGLAYPRMRALSEEQLNTAARERSHLMESIRAFSTIKLLGREAEREGAWRNLFADMTNANTRLAQTKSSVDALQFGFTALSGIAVVYLAAGYVIGGGGFTVGMLFAFISFRQTFTDRTTSLVSQMTQFRLLGLHLERLGDIVAVEVEPKHMPASAAPVDGRITLRGVGYRYGDADPFIVRGIDLDIAAGEYVAIVGPSGGGKTTLLKLVLGLLPPTEGQVVLDGVTADIPLFRHWRASVGVVAQADRLLSGSIEDNISFFDPFVDKDQVRFAAQQAQIHDDIMRMPLSYFSLVGDMGSALSEGQKQRVLLARALYRRPRVLILDEGTANLDLATEDLIADVVARLDVTRIVVAHRPALVERADRVLTVDPGATGLRPLDRPSRPAFSGTNVGPGNVLPFERQQTIGG